MRDSQLHSAFYADRIEAGCDEAGRGCLAGPVVAAAVILPKDCKIIGLNDSKQLSEKARMALKIEIERVALDYAIGVVSHTEIDAINILQASFLAMHRALDQLALRPEHLLIDGNRFKTYGALEHHCIVGGDGKYLSIAAASILAKTHRDEVMAALHEECPLYGWNRNKGYPAKAHRDAIRAHGVSKYHRMTFRLLNDQPSLFG